jgi:hypothetical protein
MAYIVNSSSLVLDPIKMLRCFDDDKFEAMVRDWQSTYIGQKYIRVEKLGGATDEGRDIACSGLKNDYHIFQCKNYNRKLGPADILLEIGKICYYSFRGDYSFPVEHRFVSPLGVTPTAVALFSNPGQLKQQLKEKWEKICQTKICSLNIPLTPELEAHINKNDFSVFNYVSPEEFLEDFQKTRHYSEYFLIILKPRPLPKPVPEDIAKKELNYISKLLSAYSDFLDLNIDTKQKLEQTDSVLYEDFKRQRRYFYSAECLAEYSREVTPSDEQWFEQLKEEFFDGIIEEINEDAEHGFERLRKVLKRATELQISQSQLSSAIKIPDRKGICHHLANEKDEIVWTRK